MAKLQAVIAMTLDGAVPPEGEPLLEWVKSDRNGFPYWRERCSRRLFPGYPLIDLICEKDTSGPSTVFLAEICDEESVELLRGLSLYRLIDELVIFLSSELLHEVAINHCRRLHLQYTRQPSETEAYFLFLWFSAFCLLSGRS